MKIKNFKKNCCPTCEGKVEIKISDDEIDAHTLNKMDAIFVDVRELDDHALHQYHHSEKPVVVCCHKGIRSKRLVNEMRDQGYTHFYSLKGGATSL